jgi:hypothetical protein
MQWLKQDPRKNNDLQKQYTEDTLLSSTNPAKNRIRECWVLVWIKIVSDLQQVGNVLHPTLTNPVFSGIRAA